ncbi:acyltransferase [Streptomyces sp. NPDC049915]|uniref:acyltransferase family protein n=1 Tax=Streptomyces sp. NPDC049915 TaxID=3155510 RepID=UPI003441AD13
MHRGFPLRWSHGTVAELLTGRNNSLGLLRLCLALAVVFSHARVLGYGGKEYLHYFSGGQADLGKLAVYGFFVLSGILVTRSGARLTVGRFLWHRMLRILPGFWVCLGVTAFVLAPLLYWHLHSTFHGLNGPHGPVDYLRADWGLSTDEQDISHIMTDARSAGRTHAVSFNGALWSLHYEVMCYVGVAVLAVTGILTRARRAVLVITAVLGWLVIRHASRDPLWAGQYDSHYLHYVRLPLVGQVSPSFMIYLGFAFGLGALVEAARHRIPVSDPLGAASLLVLFGSLHYGYLFTVGIPAFAYVLVWLAVRLPAPFRRIGARNDYSYGIYIYGFPVQQTLALLGWTRWGIGAYLALTLVFTLLLAAASWHLVERPALRWKDVGKGHGGKPTLSSRPVHRHVPERRTADATAGRR